MLVKTVDVLGDRLDVPLDLLSACQALEPALTGLFRLSLAHRLCHDLIISWHAVERFANAVDEARGQVLDAAGEDFEFLELRLLLLWLYVALSVHHWVSEIIQNDLEQVLQLDIELAEVLE